jgi:indolepyruvate ferredoxin oxidoreductase
MAKLKFLRGGPFDIFGRTHERKLERKMIADYEALLAEIAASLTGGNYETATALAGLPLDVKGYGYIKDANYEKAKARETALLKTLRTPEPQQPPAAIRLTVAAE